MTNPLYVTLSPNVKVKVCKFFHLWETAKYHNLFKSLNVKMSLLIIISKTFLLFWPPTMVPESLNVITVMLQKAQ